MSNITLYNYKGTPGMLAKAATECLTGEYDGTYCRGLKKGGNCIDNKQCDIGLICMHGICMPTGHKGDNCGPLFGACDYSLYCDNNSNKCKHVGKQGKEIYLFSL